MNSLLSKSFSVAERVERLSNSLGQDIICNMGNGKTKTIKLVQYVIITKRKIGDKLMLDSLGYLGHSLFYDELNNIEIQFAELNVKNQSNGSFVRKNVHPLSLVTLVFDNCDHNSETLPGVSLHVTYVIMIHL